MCSIMKFLPLGACARCAYDTCGVPIVVGVSCICGSTSRRGDRGYIRIPSYRALPLKPPRSRRRDILLLIVYSVIIAENPSLG